MRISTEKKEKIYEHILAFLYSNFPKSLFTFNIAQELAIDEEYIKKLLLELKKKTLVIEINKNSQGILYKRRSRWSLSQKAYEIYKQNQFSN